MTTKHEYAIGIDLGTSNCCVGVVRNGKVEIIANEQGNRLTPSFVAFTDTERFVGESAKYQRYGNPSNTVFEVKRLIGRKFTDPAVQESIKKYSYKVIQVDGNPRIAVQYRGAEKIYTPEEISAMLLGKMKEVAEISLGCAVKKAVVTVPAYFTDSQRQATMDAGTIAGLEVLKIINEPTAAAIAYGEDILISKNKSVLVFDFGGGTFDVSILDMRKGEYVVKTVQGDSQLGGGDLDSRLADYLAQEFQKTKGVDISGIDRAKARIHRAAEQAKINLSSQMKALVQVENVHQREDLDSFVSRTKFEHICDDLFQKTMTCVDEALKDAGLTEESIEDVVLVGGSSWIPKIEKLLKQRFGSSKIKRNINPAEAVAYGAAVQAAMLNGDEEVEDIKLSDVTPLSLGVALIYDRFSVIIKRNSPIPAKFTKTVHTVHDYQTRARIEVYEGENPVASKNHYLGEFVAENIEKAPAGVPKIDVTFSLDRNGILNATAVDRKTGGGGKITISVNKGRLVKEDIERMVKEMRDIKEYEDQQRAIVDASASLEETIAKKKELLERKKKLKKISNRGYETLLLQCEDAADWLERHEDATKQEFDEKENAFNETFNASLADLSI